MSIYMMIAFWIHELLPFKNCTFWKKIDQIDDVTKTYLGQNSKFWLVYYTFPSFVFRIDLNSLILSIVVTYISAIWICHFFVKTKIGLGHVTIMTLICKVENWMIAYWKEDTLIYKVTKFCYDSLSSFYVVSMWT